MMKILFGVVLGMVFGLAISAAAHDTQPTLQALQQQNVGYVRAACYVADAAGNWVRLKQVQP